MTRTIRTVVIAIGAILGLAACGQTPTRADAVAPRHGFTFGGGNVTGGGADSTSVQSAESPTTCEERGGFTLGGGNVAGQPGPCVIP